MIDGSQEGVFIAATAIVSEKAKISPEVKIWDFSNIRENVEIEKNVSIGMQCYIGPGVQIGESSKIQNGVMIYQPTRIGRGVFVGPGVIFTNDLFPRAVNTDFNLKSHDDWVEVGVEVEEGASIGAGVVCVAPVRIGRWAMIGAGAVVCKDVPDFAQVIGVPARQIGWVGRAGLKLEELEKNIFICSVDKTRYKLSGTKMSELT
jgi:UDP-2-acetamido-3-amino-2,3-dideoxy-glucuronate N-acetyltransferase